MADGFTRVFIIQCHIIKKLIVVICYFTGLRVPHGVSTIFSNQRAVTHYTRHLRSIIYLLLGLNCVMEVDIHYQKHDLQIIQDV